MLKNLMRWRCCLFCVALGIFSCSFQGKLMVEIDSSNTISWVALSDVGPWTWRFHIYLKVIKSFTDSIEVVFCLGAFVESIGGCVS